MISTNEQRQGDGLSIKLKKLERFLALGRTEEQAAVAYGVSVATIKSWLVLLEAGPAVKKAFLNGQLSASAAVKLAKLPREQQAEAVTTATADGKATTAKAGRVAKAKKAGTAAQDAITPPSKKTLKWVMGSNAQVSTIGPSVAYGEGFRAALKWVTGALAAKDVPGLEELLPLDQQPAAPLVEGADNRDAAAPFEGASWTEPQPYLAAAEAE
jgi:hypothetical protein